MAGTIKSKEFHHVQKLCKDECFCFGLFALCEEFVNENHFGRTTDKLFKSFLFIYAL